MKNISILGSTGSVGRQTLEVVDWFPDKFKVKALTGRSNVKILAQQTLKYDPDLVVIYDESLYATLKAALPNYQGKIAVGLAGLIEAATWPDVHTVVTAVSGVIGLLPTVEAVKKGKVIALANKETLVAGGEIVMPLVKKYQTSILPVDSEHSAIFQCLRDEKKALGKILLTASGGPFRQYTEAEMTEISPKDALKHPNWSMGWKISIDSATMMNKGLEVIEAKWLFDVSLQDIEIIIHPESIIHSMVQYCDGSILAHLGKTDMKIPIQYALTYPERWPNELQRLDFAKLGKLTFSAPDQNRFPCLKLALEAGSRGGTMPAVMNAANELLVQKFYQEDISYQDIARYLEKVMMAHETVNVPSLDTIIECDSWAREYTEKEVLK